MANYNIYNGLEPVQPQQQQQQQQQQMGSPNQNYGGYGMPQIPQMSQAQQAMPRFIGATQSSMDMYNRQDPVAAQSKGMLSPSSDDSFAVLPDWAKQTFGSFYGRQGQGQGELANQFLNQRDVGLYNQQAAGHENLTNPWAFNGGGMDPTKFNIFQNNSSINYNPYAGWGDSDFQKNWKGRDDNFDIWAQHQGYGGFGKGDYNKLLYTPQQSTSQQMLRDANEGRQRTGGYGLTETGLDAYKNYMIGTGSSQRDVWTGAKV